MRTIHPIERESYEILRRRVETAALPHWTRAVVERVVHASADLSYVDDLVCDEDSLVRGAEALAIGAPLVVDAAMVAAGITTYPSTCLVADPDIAKRAESSGRTRSAEAVVAAGERVGPGAVWVVGNAPTALFTILELAPVLRPTLVIGLPVGFVGAVESKQALRDAGLPAVTNRSEKGGSAIAAAALNALLYGPNPEENS